MSISKQDDLKSEHAYLDSSEHERVVEARAHRSGGVLALLKSGRM